MFIFGVDRAGLLLLADAGVLQPHAGVPGRVPLGLQARRSSACPAQDACSASFARRRPTTLAAVLLGLATFSKPTNILAALPLFLLPLYAAALVAGAPASAAASRPTVVALFLINVAATGEPNYQGGDRKTFYSSTGFPFANTSETFENSGQRVATGSVPTEILLQRNTAIVIVVGSDVFRRRHDTAAWCRTSSPACSRPCCFSPGAPRGNGGSGSWRSPSRAARSACSRTCRTPTRAAAVRSATATSSASIRCSCSSCRPCAACGPALVALAIGALFIAKVTLNPFYSSFHPGEHAKAGPLRMLPIERSLLNDLPVSADPARSRLRLAGTPPSSFYFVDDGAYVPEGDFFWVKGGRRADLLDSEGRPSRPRIGARVSLKIRTMRVEIANTEVRERGRGLDGRAPREDVARARRAARRRALARTRRAVQAGAVSDGIRLRHLGVDVGGDHAVPDASRELGQPLSRRAASASSRSTRTSSAEATWLRVDHQVPAPARGDATSAAR